MWNIALYNDSQVPFMKWQSEDRNGNNIVVHYTQTDKLFYSGLEVGLRIGKGLRIGREESTTLRGKL